MTIEIQHPSIPLTAEPDRVPNTSDFLKTLHITSLNATLILGLLYRRARVDHSKTPDLILACRVYPELAERAGQLGLTFEAKKIENRYESIPHIVLPKA